MGRGHKVWCRCDVDQVETCAWHGRHQFLWKGRVSGANMCVCVLYNREVVCLCVGCSGEITWHHILRTWRYLGVCFAWQAIHTLCGRDSILVTCVENSWQEQHLVRCVWRRYCEQDLQGLLCCFCVIGGGVLRLHDEKLVAKASHHH